MKLVINRIYKLDNRYFHTIASPVNAAGVSVVTVLTTNIYSLKGVYQTTIAQEVETSDKFEEPYKEDLRGIFPDPFINAKIGNRMKPIVPYTFETALENYKEWYGKQLTTGYVLKGLNKEGFIAAYGTNYTFATFDSASKTLQFNGSNGFVGLPMVEFDDIEEEEPVAIG